jgi:hypothetical protein
MCVHPMSFFTQSDLAKLNTFFLEGDSAQRFNRFNNALINYDYKTGNYVGY